jgi:hypothetical protein
MFANLTRADFRGRSHREVRAAKRWQVHALFDEIQVAIANDDFSRVDCLMAKLVCVTASHSRASHRTARRGLRQGVRECDEQQADDAAVRARDPREMKPTS